MLLNQSKLADPQPAVGTLPKDGVDGTRDGGVLS
tara:strand:+ start:1317 stop:1418 length:102 start_codon:yes stop_codon:yes gene_type:complete